MSRYGRLWEEARIICARVQQLVPSLYGMDTEIVDLRSAEGVVATHIHLLDSYMKRWREIEFEMEKIPE